MTDTYQNWMERVVGGRDAKPLNSGELVKSSSGEPFGAVEFVKIPKTHFLAEVGKKGNKYIYHLYPSEQYLMGTRLGTKFHDTLADAFLGLFRREDQIEVDWVPEMRAWAVRVSGWTDHIWGDELAIRAIEKIDELLKVA